MTSRSLDFPRGKLGPLWRLNGRETDHFKTADCSFTVEPENPEAIAGAVTTMAFLGLADRTAMGERGKDYVLASHYYRVLARRFIDSIECREPLRACLEIELVKDSSIAANMIHTWDVDTPAAKPDGQDRPKDQAISV